MRDYAGLKIAKAAYEAKARALSASGRVPIERCQEAAEAAVYEAITSGVLTPDLARDHSRQLARQAHEAVIDGGKAKLREHAATKRAAGLPPSAAPSQQVLWADILDDVLPVGEGAVRTIGEMNAADWLAAMALVDRNARVVEDARREFTDYQFEPALAAITGNGGGTTRDAWQKGFLI